MTARPVRTRLISWPWTKASCGEAVLVTTTSNEQRDFGLSYSLDIRYCAVTREGNPQSRNLAAGLRVHVTIDEVSDQGIRSRAAPAQSPRGHGLTPGLLRAPGASFVRATEARRGKPNAGRTVRRQAAHRPPTALTAYQVGRGARRGSAPPSACQGLSDRCLPAHSRGRDDVTVSAAVRATDRSPTRQRQRRSRRATVAQSRLSKPRSPARGSAPSARCSGGP